MQRYLFTWTSSICLLHSCSYLESLAEMTKKETSEKIERLIDADLNRLKESIRVIEDIDRYIYDDAALSSTLKQL